MRTGSFPRRRFVFQNQSLAGLFQRQRLTHLMQLGQDRVFDAVRLGLGSNPWDRLLRTQIGLPFGQGMDHRSGRRLLILPGFQSVHKIPRVGGFRGEPGFYGFKFGQY